MEILILIVLATIILAIVITIFVELHTHIYKLKGVLSFQWSNHRNAQHNWLVIFAFLFVIIGLLSFVWLFYIKDFNTVMEKGATMGSWGQVGDFIGGIGGTLFSLSGFILLYISLASQRESSEKLQIEGRFFELLKLHRENTLDMEFNDPYFNKDPILGATSTEQGRIVFKRIYHQILSASKYVDIFILHVNSDPVKIYHPHILYNLHENKNIIERKISDVELAKIDIAYSLVFNGISKDSEPGIRRQLGKLYQEDFINPIITFFKLLPAKGSYFFYGMMDIVDNNSLLELLVIELNKDSSIDTIGKRLVDNNPQNANFKLLEKVVEKMGGFFKYYGGHQYKLGHYFRLLFQVVTYIDKSNSLTYDEKYYYIKTLRAQLSSYEQYIFFFNSLSHLGRVWEYMYSAVNDENKHLITKYNLIKNIEDAYGSFNIITYYPNVSFEFEDEPIGRKALIKKYF